MLKKYDVLSRFDTISERDGRTDGRTDGRIERIPISISLVSIALLKCNKNHTAYIHLYAYCSLNTISLQTIGARHSKTQHAPHCRVLPPGEFSGMNTEPLPSIVKV